MRNSGKTMNLHSCKSRPSGIPEVSVDGYLRMPFTGLKRIPLLHLISGLDEGGQDCSSEAALSTDIAGYTEWISSTTPTVTLGWDWQLEISSGGPHLARYGEPRSNIMLISGDQDVGRVGTAALLETFIESFDWRHEVMRQIGLRYSK